MEKLGTYSRNLEVLSSSITIWPHPVNVNGVGRKDTLVRNLDRISTEMGTQRPRTNTLNRGDVIPEGTVLKRTHSDSQNHVILPDSPLRSWPSMEPGPPESTWLSQGYISALREIGEWRVVNCE